MKAKARHFLLFPPGIVTFSISISNSSVVLAEKLFFPFCQRHSLLSLRPWRTWSHWHPLITLCASEGKVTVPEWDYLPVDSSFPEHFDHIAWHSHCSSSLLCINYSKTIGKYLRNDLMTKNCFVWPALFATILSSPTNTTPEGPCICNQRQSWVAANSGMPKNGRGQNTGSSRYLHIIICCPCTLAPVRNSCCGLCALYCGMPDL